MLLQAQGEAPPRGGRVGPFGMSPPDTKPLAADDSATIADGIAVRPAPAPVSDPGLSDLPAMLRTENPADDAANGTARLLQFLTPSATPGSLGRIAHYEVSEVLGRGAFGIVLKAFDEKLHRQVAIKAMTPELAATPPARKRFLREARSAAAVRNPHVVGIHAVEEDPLPYLVMEYIPGRTLHDWLEQSGPLGVPDVLRVGHQIALGLAAAHDRGIIHRDIKPANVILEQGGDRRVKITDFGLARTVDDVGLTQSGIIVGTPLFMSPEQVRGDTLDHRADLFSLGSVLYTLCTGIPPFRAPTTIAVLKRVVDEDPRPIRELVSTVPKSLCDLIARLHAKWPQDRISTAKEVADRLARCLKDLRQSPLVIGNSSARKAEPAGSRAWTNIRDERRMTRSKVALPYRPRARLLPHLLSFLLMVATVVVLLKWTLG